MPVRQISSEIPLSLALRRMDPKRKMARFYGLTVERNLFGHVVLVREWGRLGTRGRRRRDEHESEDEAYAALTAIAAQNRRRGYR